MLNAFMELTVLLCACLQDRQIRHRACALKDTVHAIIRDELEEDFEKICEETKASRSKRGECCVCVCVWWGGTRHMINLALASGASCF